MARAIESTLLACSPLSGSSARGKKRDWKRASNTLETGFKFLSIRARLFKHATKKIGAEIGVNHRIKGKIVTALHLFLKFHRTNIYALKSNKNKNRISL